MKKSIVVSGVAALGLLLAGGCTSKVMGSRDYVPTEGGPVGGIEQSKSVETPAALPPAIPEQEPLVPETEKTAPKEAPKAGRYDNLPRFEDYKGPVPSGPVKGHATVSKGGTYVVKKGDALSRIARAHNVRVSDLLEANNMTMANANKLRIGQKLVIPGGKSYSRTTAVKSSKKGSSKSSAKAASTAKGSSKASAEVSGNFYIVKRGDSIPVIAKKLHVKSAALMAANNLDEAATRRLQIGQKLVVPGREATAAAEKAVPEKGGKNVVQADKKTTDALNAADAAVESAPETAPVVPEATTPGAVAPAAPAAVAPAAAATTTETVSGSSVPVEVTEAIKLEEFVAKHRTTVEAFKKMNTDIQLQNGMIPGNSIVFVPGE